MVINYQFTEEYDKKIKLKKEELFCFSQKKLEELYPDGGYTVVGEMNGEEIEQESDLKEQEAALSFHGKLYRVRKKGSYSKLRYSRKDYCKVDEDRYVILLHDRLPFLLILIGLLILAGILLGLLLWFMSRPAALNPIPDPDPNSQQIEDDESEKMQSEQGGGAVSMVYTLSAYYSLSSDTIEIFFENPNSSNHEVGLEFYLESDGKVICIARSGLIAPGYRLDQMKINKKAVTLKEGNYTGYYHVEYYNPETGERALVESNIDNVQLVVTP